MTEVWLLPGGEHPGLDQRANASLVLAKFASKVKLPAHDEDFTKKIFEKTIKDAFKNLHNDDGFEVYDCLGDESNLSFYQNALRRRHALVDAHCGVTLSFTTESRFVSGIGLHSPLGNGIELHPVYGVPYLPSSGVKGLVRDFVSNWLDDDELSGEEFEDREDLCRFMFGDGGSEDGRAGAITFFDALPKADGQDRGTFLEFDVMTPHYGEWYQNRKCPGDWHNPIPIEFLTVPAGSTFFFALAPRRGEATERHRNLAKRWLVQALDWLGAGAKTAAGYGRFITA